jgi:phospholipid/cholesterol/gamma-HCH transport system substrate-binding protein
MGPYDPASYVCSLMVDLIPVAQIPAACFSLAKALNGVHAPLTAQLRKLLALAPAAPTTGGGAPSSALVGGGDHTLGDLLKVTP